MFENIRKRLKRPSIGTFLLIVSLIVFVVLLYVAFSVSSNCKDEELICILLGVSGEGSKEKIVRMFGLSFIALLGIWVANRRAVAMENTAQAQADAVLETEKGRRQERFRDAINHLGHRAAAVQMGGLHALFHLALEDEGLRQSIVDILCSYIRGVTGGSEYQAKHKNQPSESIRSLMALLFEPQSQDHFESLKRFWKDIIPNLSGGYFRGLELEGAQLQGVNFYKAQFQGAIFRNTRFHRANLNGANFQGATLNRVGFLQAYLGAANFRGSLISVAKFQGAKLSQAYFQGAILSKEVGFQEADLWGAQFQGVNKRNSVVIIGESDESLESRLSRARFEDQINNRIGEDADLRGVIFQGGLDKKQVDDIAKELEGIIGDDEIVSFKSALEEHIDSDKPNQPPETAAIKSYSEKDAERWINEFNK